MNNIKLTKRNSVYLKSIFKIFILLTFITTCSETPTGNNNNIDQGFSLYHEISIGEQTINNIIVKADTITAFVTYNDEPAIGMFIEFNKLNNALGTMTPPNSITDSMGVAESLYKLIYMDELLSDTIINVSIDIGVGNSENSIAVHDTVDLLYVLQAIDPLSAIEIFNFYPDNESTVNLASEGLEVSVIAKSGAGAGICNIPIRFELIGNNGSDPNGSIESEVVYTCDSNNSSEESEGNNLFGIASNQYSNINASIDYLIAKILDPSNDTLNLFTDTIKIETGSSTLLINDVASISSDASPSDITIADPDSIKTTTIYARALDSNGAIISGIPFNFSLDNNYNGAVYLSAGGSISNSLGDASSIITINPALFSFENGTHELSSLSLQISITILSTTLSDNVSLNIANNLPIGSAGNPSALFYSTISSLNFMPNNENIISSPEEEEDISIIVKDSLGGGLCNIPVSFRLEKVSQNSDIFGVISATSATTCDTANGSNISGVAEIKYNNISAGSDLLIVEIIDPDDDTVILFSDTLQINTLGSTSLVDLVTDIAANADQSYVSIFNADSIITDTIYARALDIDGTLVSGIPFQYALSENFGGSVFLSSPAATSDSSGLAYSVINIYSSIFSSDNNTDELGSLVLTVNISIPGSDYCTISDYTTFLACEEGSGTWTNINKNVNIQILNNLPFWYPNYATLTLKSESYILPCENDGTCGPDSSSVIITATVVDSLNNPPPPGTIIEFSSLQKDTTGTSGGDDTYQWIEIGNISPADTLDSDGISTVDFHMQNDRGIAHIIGSVEPFNLSDTIQIIIESKDANHIEIVPPSVDEIVVQGGGGVEYSEVFVKITDDAGNIIHDKQYLVQFELAGAPSGATLENGVTEVAKIADSGESSVTIVSGTKPGSVNLRVELFNVDDDVNSDTPIASAVTTPLTIVTGAPEYGEINFSVIDMAPVIGAGVYEYPLSVYLQDVHSNPVADSTSVYFKIRENADPWDSSLNYNYNDKVTWFDGVATVLDSVVYTCIDNVNNCLAGVQPDDNSKWSPSAHPAEIVGNGETGMASPFDDNSYPGVAFSKIIFGSNSIASEVIIFAQTYSAAGTEFIIDSRTNHSGNGIVFPCYSCAISLIALPTQWDFSQFPFNVNAETDFQDVTVTATVTDFFQFPVFNAEILLDAPQADFISVCGGVDSDLDGTTGTCVLVADGTTTLPLVHDCWTCVENYAPDYSWVIENSDNNDIADSDGALSILPDDIPNFAVTNSTGVGEWTIRYSEGVCIPQGDDPVTYQPFTTTITVSLLTPSTNNPQQTATISITKSEED